MGKHYTYTNGKRLLQAQIDWARQQNWEIEFSPNFLDGVSVYAAERMLKGYLDRLDCNVYGTYQVHRLNRRLRRMCFQEGKKGSANIHYHCAVGLPDFAETRFEQPMTVEQFCEFMKTEWESQKGAGHFTTCAPINTFDGFTAYICKTALSGSFNPLLSHL